jgi:hypothetical protein
MESIKVDSIISDIGHPHNSTTHSCLESITFPIPADPFQQREVLKIFSELSLPVLRKLTFVADPEESEVICIVAALEIASCNVQVVDFQTTIPFNEVDVDVVEPLFFGREGGYYSWADAPPSCQALVLCPALVTQ